MDLIGLANLRMSAIQNDVEDNAQELDTLEQDNEKRMQVYIDAKIANLKREYLPDSNIVKQATNNSDIKRINAEKLKQQYDVLSVKEKQQYKWFYEHIRPYLVQSEQEAFDDIFVLNENELTTIKDNIETNELENMLKERNYNVKVINHTIANKSCIKVTFVDGLVNDLTDIKDMLNNLGYVYQSKYKNAIHFSKKEE